jgi:hypothetical protein
LREPRMGEIDFFETQIRVDYLIHLLYSAKLRDIHVYCKLKQQKKERVIFLQTQLL